MAKSIVKVVSFQIGNNVHTYIHRDGDAGVWGNHYVRPEGSVCLLRLASCIHVGTLRGNTRVTPFLGGSVGWTAKAIPSS